MHEAPAAERRVRGGIAPSPDPRLLGPCCCAAPLLQPYISNDGGVAEDAVARLDDRGGTRGFAARLELEVELVEGLARHEVAAGLGLESRAAVDAMVERAAAIPGGRADPTPTQDMGFMYGRSFEDPDGHIWEISWMDPEAMENGPGELAEAQH